MAQAQDNGSKQAAGQHVEEPPSGKSAQELLDAWYASVQQELEGADADSQTIGLLGGRSSGAQGLLAVPSCGALERCWPL